MYWILIAVALIVAIYFWHPQYEGFALAAVDEKRVPACVARSVPAQQLLSRVTAVETTDNADQVAELRLLVSKLSCIESDITTPSSGATQNLQFRTSHDLEPAVTLVGRCTRGAVTQRDVDLAIDKFSARGKELIGSIFNGCSDATAEFNEIIAQIRQSMMRFCIRTQPSLDGPINVRDTGFWEPTEVSAIADYNGFSK